MASFSGVLLWKLTLLNILVSMHQIPATEQLVTAEQAGEEDEGKEGDGTSPVIQDGENRGPGSKAGSPVGKRDTGISEVQVEKKTR